MNINPSDHTSAVLRGRRTWMQRCVDSMTAEIKAINDELSQRYDTIYEALTAHGVEYADQPTSDVIDIILQVGRQS